MTPAWSRPRGLHLVGRPKPNFGYAKGALLFTRPGRLTNRRIRPRGCPPTEHRLRVHAHASLLTNPAPQEPDSFGSVPTINSEFATALGLGKPLKHLFNCASGGRWYAKCRRELQRVRVPPIPFRSWRPAFVAHILAPASWAKGGASWLHQRRFREMTATAAQAVLLVALKGPRPPLPNFICNGGFA